MVRYTRVDVGVYGRGGFDDGLSGVLVEAYEVRLSVCGWGDCRAWAGVASFGGRAREWTVVTGFIRLGGSRNWA